MRGLTLGNLRDRARLYIYTPATNEWATLDTPAYWFSLITYHSQLVLVGGVEYVNEYVPGGPTIDMCTNKLWTLSEDGQWQETLPPMPTTCGNDASAVSHGDHLLVISRDYTRYHTSNPSNKAYLYNGHHWASAQHPPLWLYSVKSTVFNGDWYVMGDGLTCSASLDSLLASCQPSETSEPSSVWKRLTFIPSGLESPAVFGNRLVAVRAPGLSYTISLYAYSSVTESWVYKGDSPPASSHQNPCAIALPSNELMVVRGDEAFIVTLQSKSITSGVLVT